VPYHAPHSAHCGAAIRLVYYEVARAHGFANAAHRGHAKNAQLAFNKDTSNSSRKLVLRCTSLDERAATP